MSFWNVFNESKIVATNFAEWMNSIEKIILSRNNKHIQVQRLQNYIWKIQIRNKAYAKFVS